MKNIIIIFIVILLFGCIKENTNKDARLYCVNIDGKTTYLNADSYYINSDESWGNINYRIRVYLDKDCEFEAHSKNSISILKVQN